VHGGQELQAYGPYTLAVADGLMFRALDAPECPLEAGEREQAKRNLAWGFIGRTIHDLREGRPRLALYRLRKSTLSLADWFRYARRPRRETDAGSPASSVKAQESVASS
jgi:hypothetical protein